MGPPHSGNGFVANTLRRTGVQADVVHGGEVNLASKSDFAVVMVRGLARWVDSATGHKLFEKKNSDSFYQTDPHVAHALSYEAIFGAIKEANIPFAVVSYESVVSDTEDTMRKLCEWAGLTFAGFNEEQNQDRTGAPYDGNAKYRKETVGDLR